MECSKDDALKAKELAEEKLLKKDYVGARIYAMKAQDLDPNLVDLPPLMAAIEVNISAEKTINGQVDWYGVLGAQPLADDVTIRRCYKTRVLMLHPDKTKSAGALEAFKLVTQAWSLFSHKDQKIIYDQNLISWGKYEEFPGGKPSLPARQNSFYNNNIFSTANCNNRDQMNATHPILTPVSPVTPKQTFWTRCRSCSIQLEYHTVYINCKIICFSCRQPLLAREEPPPPVYRNDSSTSIVSQMKQHNFSSTRIERNCHASGRNPMYAVNSSLESGRFSMPGGISSVPTPMFAVNSSLESGHFSIPAGISSVPTSMFAVNSSRESGLFSMPGRYEDIPGLKPSVPAPQNVFCNNSDGTHPIPTPVSPVLLKQTFWTRCDSCGTQFEYRTTYINCKLICTSCRQPFLAHEVPPPPVSRNISSTSTISEMNQHNFNSTRIERSCHASGRTPMYANPLLGSSHFSMPGGIYAVPTSASTAAEAPGVYGMLSENLKRQREDSTPIIREEHHFGKTHALVRDISASALKSYCFAPVSVLIGDSSRKIRRTDGNQVHDDGRDMETKIAYEKDSLDTGRTNASGLHKCNDYQELSQVQMRNTLVEKAQKHIREKLGEWKSSSLPRNFAKPNNSVAGETMKIKERVVSGVKHAAPEFVDSENIGNKCYSADCEVTENLTMSVPDPDFHDFDGDRTENAFGDNQIWASYDNDDGMPRFYAFVYNVISKEHFKVRISWLSSKTNDELAPIKWVGAGFAKTVGDLRIGKHDVFSTTLNSFSHRVKWTKGSRGLIHIYPMKGDVWALYRNWSVEWNEFTKEEIVHKYDMVEVLDDYSEEQGVNVAPLAKVAGFKTVFRRNEDPRKIMNIPKVEMFRFSHQVPSFLLTGQEGPNAPSGCLELDPAATPNELLHTSIEAPEEEMTIEKSSEEEPIPNVTFMEAAVEDLPRKEEAGSG
ncbi:putative DnaJ domain-containing protein [Lupinus albus]|uniref:Putative DnaJ domain-containing protein n=1 Tax=Lupinus albus TaxID=3870 RepID=A0A6A4Q481_LUPAL|nr:putative DnaJ domain-containing protein [Lupinus albus]